MVSTLGRVLSLALFVTLVVTGCASHDEHSEASSAVADPATSAAAVESDASAGCVTNGDCGERQYCAKPDGDCDGSAGECAERPEICTQDWTPVCGCDGTTYGNRCGAASAGQNIAHEGECREGAEGS